VSVRLVESSMSTATIARCRGRLHGGLIDSSSSETWLPPVNVRRRLAHADARAHALAYARAPVGLHCLTEWSNR
jgi:hypothetical protein